VNVKDNYFARIDEVTVADPQWSQKHWATIENTYAKAPCFDQYRNQLKEIYRQAGQESHLSRINYIFIAAINQMLGIQTKISWSMDYGAPEGKNERLVYLCKQADASLYISGPAARGYLDESLFASENIQVCWMDYCGYMPYRQLYPPFEHGVTVLDLLLNEGPQARQFMKSFV
jgi:hypothetical protein